MMRQFTDAMIGMSSPLRDDRLGLEAFRRRAHAAMDAEIDTMFPQPGDVDDDPECE